MKFFDLFGKSKIVKDVKRYFKVKAGFGDLTVQSNFENINKWLECNLDVLRDQSRTSSSTNPYFKKLLRAVPRNVLGLKGITVAPNAVKADGSADVKLNQAVTSAFDKFSEKNFDPSGKTRLDHEKSILKQILVDGEYFARTKVSAKYPDRIGVTQLDPANCPVIYNDSKDDATIIVCGIKYDRETMKPISYFFVKDPLSSIRSSNSFSVNTEKLIEIPAEEIIHIFESIYPNQARGIPTSAQALQMMRNLDGISEASVIATRIGASQVMVIEQTEDASGKRDAFTGDAVTDDGTDIIDMTPGQANILPKGYKVGSGFNPAFPSSMVLGLEKSFLQQVAAVFNVSYQTLTGDYTKVNFSSGKLGIQEEREFYEDLQSKVAKEFSIRIYNEWLPYAVLGKKLVNGTTVFPATVIDKLDEPKFNGRRWKFLEPSKDSKANTDQVNLGTKSRQQIAREQGDDWEQIKKELMEEAQFEAEINKIKTPASDSDN